MELKVEKYYKKNEDRSLLTGRYYIKNNDKNNAIAHFEISNIDWICRIATIKLDIYDNKSNNEIPDYVHNIINSMVNYLYNELNLLKIKTKIYSNKDNLIKYFQDFGFEIEGFLKNELYLNGEFYDYIYLSFFRNNYNGNIIKIDYKIEDKANEEDIPDDKENNNSLKKIGSAFRININKNTK